MNKLLYLQNVKSIRDSVSPANREIFDVQLAGRQKDPTVALILSLYTGWFGLDRFYIGDVVLGALKLITLGGLVIWAIIDWFLIMGAARRANVGIAGEIRQFLG